MKKRQYITALFLALIAVGAAIPTGGEAKVLNLKLYLEGFYAGSGMMNPAMDASAYGGTPFPKWGAAIADVVTVELHNTSDGAIDFSAPAQLMTDGTLAMCVPDCCNGSYYVTIRHRNHFETVSANVVSFAGDPVAYDFSTSVSQAYRDNEKDIAGTAVIYLGDITNGPNAYPNPPVQDGMLDIDDLTYIFDSMQNSDYGYQYSDLNGDSKIDTVDNNLAYANYLLSLFAYVPDVYSDAVNPVCGPVPDCFATTLRINFQPAAAPVPAGYLSDCGGPYSTYGTYDYGWI